jgi:hypothetical protein
VTVTRPTRALPAFNTKIGNTQMALLQWRKHAPKLCVGCKPARQVPHLDHGWVAPEAELVLAVAVAGQDLALVSGPLQRTHLAARVNRVELGASAGVPEPAEHAAA